MSALIKSKTVLLTPREAAARLRVSESTLAKWRMTAARRLPFVKVGAKVVYAEAAIEQFISERARVSTSDCGEAA